MSSYSGATSGALGGSGSGASIGSSSGGFPLRANFFRSLALSKDTTEALYQDAKQNAAACLKQSFNEQWRYVPPEKDGTQLRKDTSNLATSCRYVRAATVLRCQEHEVNMVIANTNTESWREFMRKCFGKHYIDTMILHSFTGASVNANANINSANDTDNNRAHRSASDRPDQHHSATTADQGQRQTLWLNGPIDLDGDDNSNHNQSNQDELDKRRRNSDTQSVPSDDDSSDDVSEELLTVKWGALDTGGQGKRDLCVVDYLSTATIPNTEPKERVHLWCFSSVEGERVGCMALKDTHGITRTSLSKLGVFWRRVNDEETEVIVCGSFASKHAKYVSAIFLQSLNRLQGIVEDLRLSNQIYIHRSTWVKDHERSSCHLCMRNFYALRRKHHCRRCGEVICSDCSVVENVDLPVIGYSKLRLCKVCCLKAKSTPLKRNTDKSNVFDHLVRARSLSNVNNLSSPYNARMSFADTGSNGSGGNNHNHHLHNGFGHQQSQSMQPLLNRGATASLEQAGESTSRSSSSFSSSNTNDFELTDSLEDYTHLHAAAAVSHSNGNGNNNANANAIVHPMSKEMRGLSSATVTTTSSSTASSTPMLTTQDDDDYDDFIDAKCLNKQLKTMELKQKQKHGGRPANSNMFDLLCDLACQTLNCPIASVSIVDAQLGDPIRSVTGINDKPELDEELSLFIDKVMGSTPTIVLDANVDKQVTSLFTRRGAPAIRFFAGCPIYNKTGKKLGYICVADFTKRDTLGPSCAFTMERLATLAVTTMEKNLASKQQQQSGERDFFSTPPQAREPITPITPYVTGNFGGASNNQTAHFTEQRAPPPAQPQQAQHPAAIFDRPTPGAMPRHRQSSAHMNHVPPPPPPPPSQYHSAAQAYQYHEAYPQAVHARVYDLADEVPVGIGSPVNYSRSAPAPPVAPLPRQYNEYSAGYYEAQERMRKLLIKSYHTQQQLATGSTPNSATPTGVQAAYHAQY